MNTLSSWTSASLIWNLLIKHFSSESVAIINMVGTVLLRPACTPPYNYSSHRGCLLSMVNIPGFLLSQNIHGWQIRTWQWQGTVTTLLQIFDILKIFYSGINQRQASTAVIWPVVIRTGVKGRIRALQLSSCYLSTSGKSILLIIIF